MITEAFRNMEQWVVVSLDNCNFQTTHNFWNRDEAISFGEMLFLQDDSLNINIYREKVQVVRSKRAIISINKKRFVNVGEGVA